VLGQVLWIDVLLKASVGAMLLVLPRVTVAAFGLPRSDQPFYLRVLGGLLLSVALAIFADAARWIPDGLGAGGSAMINIAGGVLIVALLILRPFVSLRGRISLWGLGALLFLLGLAQLVMR